MEATTQQQEHPASRVAYRTAKPPDQCVISYNFEHADSVNFTHNLLIGIGLEPSLKTHRKQDGSKTPPDKEKLFSIITQPKKVFRNEAHSVNKAYNSILPKRYLPQKIKKPNRKEGNNSNYEMAQRSDEHVNKQARLQQQNNTKLQNSQQLKKQTFLKEQTSLVKHEAYLLHDIINSPYGNPSQHKNHKSRLHHNQNNKKSYNHSPTSPKTKQKSQPQEHPTNHSKPYLNPLTNLKTQHNQYTINRSIYSQKQNHPKFNNKERLNNSNAKSNKSKSDLNNSKGQLSKSKKQFNQSRKQLNSPKKLKTSKQQLNSPKKSVKNLKNQANSPQNEVKSPKKQRPHTQLNHSNSKISKGQFNSSKKQLVSPNKLLSSNKSLSPKPSKANVNINSKKQNSPQNKSPSFVQSRPQLKNDKGNSISKVNIRQKNNDRIIKGKKQIQDQQLQELQSRVRRQESSKFKKGNFKISKNKEREVLPFQASIQPLFSTQKSSLQNDLKLANSTKNPRGSEHGLKGNTSFKAINKVNANKDAANNRQDGQGKSKSIDNTKTNPLAKSKLQTITKPKNIAHNVAAIETSQKIKRNHLQKNQPNSVISKGNQQNSQDLTVDNQIKGFKVLPKVVSAKIPKTITESNSIARTSNKQLKRQSTANDMTKKPIPSVKSGNNSSLKANQDKTQNADKQMPARHRYSEISEQAKSLQGSAKRPNQSIALAANPSNSSNFNPGNNKISSKSNRVDKQKSQSIETSSAKPNTPLKSTVPRNSNDKDYKLKKWRQSELQQVERLRRDSKRKSQNSPKPKQITTTRKDSKFIPKPKTPQIDLDADQEDKFGLRTKRKSNSSNKAKLNKSKKKKQIINNEMSNLSVQSDGQLLMDHQMQQISSIHSSKITEIEQQTSEKAIMRRDTLVQHNNQDLEQLIQATQEHNQTHFANPIEQQQEGPNASQEKPQGQVQQNAINHQQKEEQQSSSQSEAEPNQQPSKEEHQNQHLILITPQQCSDQKGLLGQNSQSSPFQHNQERIQPKQLSQINQNAQHLQRTEQAETNPNNASIKEQDFFQCNIKDLSKFNETVNQTFNMTKYQFFQKDINQYTRAPITSFFYGECQQTKEQMASFTPTTLKTQLLFSQQQYNNTQFQIVDKAINILLSIDPWIIQRIFEPYLNQNKEIGIWLYYQGFWKVYSIQKCTNFREPIVKALSILATKYSIQLQLQSALRIISGVRVAKLKSTKKRVFSQLDYSLKKKHVLKAVTSKDSKWGQRLFEVVKVETSAQGGNVLKIKQKSDFFWVRQQKFKEIFQHFILICTRPSHFWTNKFIANKQSHKSVLSFSSEVVTHGSITLYYPSEEKSSLYLYKELESKVLKYMGSLQQKANQNGNIYFQFRVHGTYYLFLQTPANCQMAIESTSKLVIGQPQYIVSQTLKNDKCEYVQLQQGRQQGNKGGKQAQTLLKLRQKFINMVSSK